MEVTVTSPVASSMLTIIRASPPLLVMLSISMSLESTPIRSILMYPLTSTQDSSAVSRSTFTTLLSLFIT